ncbi:sugar ABC transporter permease [Paenibacillus swuensis]|uniref:Sugar ABC transporter permease n=1 Tax=Paenibacillus swuensis TaxID=1178515 RepID=A0A172TGT8_9BACL|nr:carbohydrate ABC transporter permease [Paenibacillus swuensis]ANE46156.1 sugar ABC transporter permease [Paenibacillus swuensis]
MFQFKRGINSVSPLTGAFIHLLFIVITCLCLIPVFLVISVSLSDEKTVLSNGYKFFPEKFSTYAYEFLFRDSSQILTSYGVTLLVTITGTVLGVLIMALYAYPIARNDFPHRKLFSFLVFFTMLFNGGLVSWYMVYVKMLDLKDSLWALIIPLMVGPFFVLILRTFFKGLPGELIESAKIDGAGEFRIFLRIVLPLSTPALATVGLFTTLNYWNDWFMSLLYITDSSKVSLQYLMYKTMLNIQYLTSNAQAAQGASQGGSLLETPSETVRMAMCIIGIGPIVLAYPFFQRYFVKGLMVGAIKG